jgi:hypothetical protein
MLAVSPPGPSSSFEERYLAHQGKDSGSNRAEEPVQDAILGPGWDLGPISSPSPSSGSSSISDTGYDSTQMSGSSELTSSGLLIRSKYQGWERSFELHHDWPIPRIEAEDEILIKNVSVGLNPVDFKR